MKTWTKTLLSSYRYLERVANAIDKIVYTRAINSFYVSGQNLAFNSIHLVSEDILNLTERKVSLINLKVVLDEAFKKINSKYSEILITIFVENKNCFQSCEALNISLRTFFRRQKEALESFSKVLNQFGYTSKSFEKSLKKENWIQEIKARYVKEDKQDTEEKQCKINIKTLTLKEKETGSNFNLHTHNNLHF